MEKMSELAPSVRKTVTFGYGAFAAILMATLVIGVVSGIVFGVMAGSLRSARLALPGAADTDGRAWLGVTYVPINASVATSYKLSVATGALIIAVTPNGPAAQAGMRQDDIVTAVDHRPIDENTNITDIIKDKKPQDHILMTILRNGSEQTIDITLGRVPAGSMGSR
jgi:serine protease Do